MRKNILLIFLLLTQKIVFTQYYSLPDSNANWTVVKFLSTPFTYQWYNYATPVNKNDTTINAKVYTKLFMTYPSGGYLGAFRSVTTGQTWFIPKDSTTDFLLMDLSKNTGDTIYNLLAFESSYSLVNVVVDSTKNISVGPYSLKSLYIHYLSSSCPASWKWIEKLGCTSGFFNRYCWDMEYNFTYCISSSDTTFFQNPSPPSSPSNSQCCPTYTFGTCNFVNGVLESTFEKQDVNISPNPFSSLINISFKNANVNSIKIYNAEGIICKTYTTIYSSININFDNMPEGLYIVRMLDKNGGFITSKRIIKVK